MRKELITYETDGKVFEASVVFPANKHAPVVIVCHAWNGRDAFVQEAIEKMAALGYVGVALDVYGQGVLGRSREENIQLKAPLLQDRQMLKRRLQAGVTVAQGLGAPSIAAMGFGFGGLCALDIARSEPNICAAISIYGHFEEADGLVNKDIRASVLVLHGAEDPIVPQKDLHAFGNDLTKHSVDWQSHLFGNTMHAFMNPAANDPANGVQYQEASARRAWDLIRLFLEDSVSSV